MNSIQPISRRGHAATRKSVITYRRKKRQSQPQSAAITSSSKSDSGNPDPGQAHDYSAAEDNSVQVTAKRAPALVKSTGLPSQQGGKVTHTHDPYTISSDDDNDDNDGNAYQDYNEDTPPSKRQVRHAPKRTHAGVSTSVAENSTAKPSRQRPRPASKQRQSSTCKSTAHPSCLQDPYIISSGDEQECRPSGGTKRTYSQRRQEALLARSHKPVAPYLPNVPETTTTAAPNACELAEPPISPSKRLKESSESSPCLPSPPPLRDISPLVQPTRELRLTSVIHRNNCNLPSSLTSSGPFRATERDESRLHLAKNASTFDAVSSPQAIIRQTKRRLIDELASQEETGAEDSDLEESGEESDREMRLEGEKRPATPPFEQPPIALSRQSSMAQRDGWIRRSPSRRPGLKFTYSSQRSILLSQNSQVSESVFGQGPIDDILLAPLTTPAFEERDDNDDDQSLQMAGIRSLHELRQAGASSRFTDEMEDLLDRVGTGNSKPSLSMRRGALIDLVNKLQDRAFRRQFRDFGGDLQFFSHVVRDTDIICAVLMACVFLSLLDAGIATHITHKMGPETLESLVSPLLDVSNDFEALSRPRSLNMSKHMQTRFVGIGSLVQKLSVWSSQALLCVTPQIIALKCLDLSVERVPEKTLESIVDSQIVDHLFSLLPTSASPSQPGEVSLSYESQLALTVLKIFSVKAAEVATLRQKWTRDRLPLIITALVESLKQREPDHRARSLLSQLALNMTNNNTEAVVLVADEKILHPILEKLGEEISKLHTYSSSSLANQLFSASQVDNLVLLLGAMVNFCEDNDTIKIMVAQWKGIDTLIRSLVINYKKQSEADSVDKTQINVAFGYLAVLLGYLCLDCAAIRSKFKSLNKAGTLEPLLVTLRKFVTFHAAVEKQEGRSFGEFENKMSTLIALLEQKERRSATDRAA